MSQAVINPPPAGSRARLLPARLSPLAEERLRASSASGAVLNWRPLQPKRMPLQLHAFDADYMAALCAGDARTEAHFVSYFTELLHLKLRSRLKSPQAIEDVRQETFVRVLGALRKQGALRQPERLGAYVNTVCNNVLFEHYRASSRSESLDEEDRPELPAPGADVVDIVAGRQLKEKVREILRDLPDRDRLLLQAVFIEERDREEVCREFRVDLDYLRVLLYRARKTFKAEYLRRMAPAIQMGKS